MRYPGLALFLGVALAGPAAAQQSTAPTFVQGAAFSTGPMSATTVALSSSVAQGDLLVGWFSQFHAPGEVQVSDNVNGAWTRAPASLHFVDDTGDIALYYRENSQAAPGGMTITVSASASAFFQGAVAEYSGVALAGSLDQIVAARAPDGTAVDTGSTAAVGAGELVYAAVVASPAPGGMMPGSSVGVPYTPRAQTANESSFEEDITSSAAGGQHGTATLSSATDWYAVCAVFHPTPATPPVPPSTPAGLEATSVASTRVALSWSPSTGSVAGYTVHRGGAAIGTARPDTTTFLDADAAPSTTFTYSVDAFDLANDHSAPSLPLTVTTPAQSPEFIQGAAVSSGGSVASETLTLTEPVAAGDLLVGWFSQFDVPGEVQVSDNVNGPWTRSVSTTFSGAGDIALYYRENSAAAPSGLAITVSASAPANLQAAAADYRHAATAGALFQAVVSGGQGTNASAGPSASVLPGKLVVAAVITGGQPGYAIPGSSQRVPYVLDVRNGSASSLLEDILSSAGGPQEGSLTLASATSWFMVLAIFLPPSTTTTTQPATTTTTQPTTSTTSTSSTTTTLPPTTTTTSTSSTTTAPPATTSTTTLPPTTTTTSPTSTTTVPPATTSTTTSASTTTTTLPPTTTTTSPISTTTVRPATTSTTTSASTTTTTLPGTTTGLTSSVHPWSVFGQPVTFTATVTAKSPGAGTPTGTVTFKDGSSTLGTGTLNSSGQAMFTTSTLAVGPHSITASYGGDATFSGSTSSPLTQTVRKAGTTTLVSSSANPSVSGQAVTFTATVTAKSPGAGTPTGTVTFKDGSSTLGTGTLNSSGQAMFTTSTLTVGSHSITASYGGDTTFKEGTSPKFTQTVNP